MKIGLFPGQGLEPRVVEAALPAQNARVIEASEILGYDLHRQVVQCRSRRMPTRLAQPAIFVAGVVAVDDAARRGERFDAFVGHSLGEYTALVSAGAISFADGVKLVGARAQAMSRAAAVAGGGMAAVLGLGLSDVEGWATSCGLTIANDNSADQIVISGDEDSLRSAAAIVREHGGRCIRLGVEGPFHSYAMRPAEADLRDALDRVSVRLPRIPVIANVTAHRYRAPGEIRRLLLFQLTGRVRFRESIEWLVERGARSFADLGPGDVVGRLARATADRLTGVGARA